MGRNAVLGVSSLKHKDSRTLTNVRQAFPNEKHQELKRETAFLCPIDFKNEIPPVPFEWKLLHELEGQIANPHNKKVTSDQYGLKRDFTALSADLGITLNQILPNTHRVTDPASLLHSADASLVSMKCGTYIANGDTLSSKVKKPDLSKALWLMNTQYISSMALPEHLGRSEKDWAKVRKGDANEGLYGAKPRRIQLASIKQSFEAAIDAPIHDKHPQLFATNILPVLPDFSRYERSHIHVTYDEDPDVDNCKTFDASSIKVEDSLAKPYSVAGVGPEAHTEKFVTMFIPSNSTTSDADTTPKDYQSCRDYQYSLQHDPASALRTLCLFTDEKVSTVKYVDVKSKLVLRKRSKRANEDSTGLELRPGGIKVKRTSSSSDNMPGQLKI